jgi:protein-S-isoprenylcysteine O-methyltransferase Ste14
MSPSRLDDFAKLQQSRGYDLVMRLPLLAWSVLCTMAWISGLTRYMREADPALPNTVYAINIAMRLSAIAFLVLLAASVILRGRPAGKARGIEPRISALLGTLVVYSFSLFPRHELSPSAQIVSTLLILVGSAAAVYVLSQLGRSFSVMAEARRLVTSGVYGIVRHPLYLAEELAVIGIFMQFVSVWTTLLLAVQIAFQLRRMRNEEVILGETFPEYATYKAKTARLIPGIY